MTVTKTKPIAYDRNNERQQLRLPSSAKKPIDRTQLHRSQSIQYNQYRSIRTDPFAPSASYDHRGRVDPFAPSASCDYPRGADPFAPSAFRDYPRRVDPFAPSAPCDRSQRFDPLAPSAFCDRSREVNPFAPIASCDRSRGNKQPIVTSATIASQARSLRSAV
jgi:hypothetical protein